jgi:hypothetical protein
MPSSANFLAEPLASDAHQSARHVANRDTVRARVNRNRPKPPNKREARFGGLLTFTIANHHPQHPAPPGGPARTEPLLPPEAR